MEKMKDTLRIILTAYEIIVSCVLLATALYIAVFYGMNIKVEASILWEIMGITLLCACGTPIIIPMEDTMSQGKILLRYVLHFCYINLVVGAGGVFLDWFSLSNIKMTVGMEIVIVITYAIVMVISYIRDIRMAEEINKKLEKRKE